MYLALSYFNKLLSQLFVHRLFNVIREVAGISANAPKSLKNYGPIYFLGHSLGSHICAYASHLIRESQRNNSESWVVSRITGLDPAQPCFTNVDDILRLNNADAAYIDVIHTNAKFILFLGLGLPHQMGACVFFLFI